MKPAAFRLADAANLNDAAQAVVTEGAKFIAGGQSLGPMLNFRVVQPPVLVRLTAMSDLRGVAEDADHVFIGATVTHAEIAAGLAPALGPGAHADILPRIAAAIAYPAVRTRGTVGGSLAHADPAADWVNTFTALGAAVLTFRAGSKGRAIPMARFVLGAFATALEPGEIIHAVRIPKLSAEASWGYYKACRKPGEFAHAMATAMADPARGVKRVVIGAVGGRPLVVENEAATPEGVAAAIRDGDTGLDRIQQQMQIVACARAAAQAGWNWTR